MQNSVRIRSLLISILVHLALLLLLMFTFLHMPDPPMGGGEGMIVNLGYSVEGSGDIQPLSEEITQEVHAKVSPPPTPVAENKDFVTQDNEESQKIETEKATTKEVSKTPEKKSEVKPTEKKHVEESPKVNPDALYKGKKNNASSQGNDVNKTGDKGDPKGDPNSKYYGKSGTGNTPGSGSGNGSGGGTGNGKGPQVDLSGRKIQNLKDINIHDVSQETGIVVVSITVDKYGKVTKAIPGGRGSNTTSASLYKKAQQAAMNARFDAQPGAAEEQRGTITFNFIVR